MKNYIKLFIAGGIAIGFAFVFYLNSFKLSESAAYLPKILMSLIVLLSLGMMYEGYIREKKQIKLKKRIDERSDEDAEPEEESGEINKPRAIIFSIMIASYIFLLKPVGYFIITPVYIISAYLFLKATKVKNMVFIAAGFTTFVYLVFVVFLKIPIPMGILQ